MPFRDSPLHSDSRRSSKAANGRRTRDVEPETQSQLSLNRRHAFFRVLCVVAVIAQYWYPIPRKQADEVTADIAEATGDQGRRQGDLL